MTQSSHSNLSCALIIPARYASSRFPGKPLALLSDGKPMLWHVWQRACQARALLAQAAPQLNVSVHIATDDPRIAQAAEAFGASVFMTSPNCPSGTDRLAEALASMPVRPDYVVNIQGDEPQLPPELIVQLVQAMITNPQWQVGTAVCPFQTLEDWQNLNRVKAILDDTGQVLYFSRAPLPYWRHEGDASPSCNQLAHWPVYLHIGLYAYQYQALQRWVNAPVHPLEQAEQLEQLRAMALGLRFGAVVTPSAPHGIDTPEDLARLNGHVF